MIDAVDLRLVKNAEDNFVQLFGGSQIAAERFFDDYAGPRIWRAGLGESRAAELFDNMGINFWRRGKIKQAVSTQLFGGFQLFQMLRQLGKILGVTVFTGV